jgi:hypothetical protein
MVDVFDDEEESTGSSIGGNESTRLVVTIDRRCATDAGGMLSMAAVPPNAGEVVSRLTGTIGIS